MRNIRNSSDLFAVLIVILPLVSALLMFAYFFSPLFLLLLLPLPRLYK